MKRSRKGTPKRRRSVKKKLSRAQQYNRSLIKAISRDDFEQADTLLNHGANPNTREKATGMTAFHAAVASGTAPLWFLQSMIDHGARVNTKSTKYSDQYILHDAIIGDDDQSLDAVSLLLSNDGKVNVKDVDGNTALHMATASGYPQMTGNLLFHGANPKIKNRDGLTAYDVASTEDVRVELLAYRLEKDPGDIPEIPVELWESIRNYAMRGGYVSKY